MTIAPLPKYSRDHERQNCFQEDPISLFFLKPVAFFSSCQSQTYQSLLSRGIERDAKLSQIFRNSFANIFQLTDTFSNFMYFLDFNQLFTESLNKITVEIVLGVHYSKPKLRVVIK